MEFLQIQVSLIIFSLSCIGEGSLSLERSDMFTLPGTERILDT